MYKHVGEEGLYITVDPTTKELTSEPSERLIELLKNARSSTTVAQLITIGVFVKLCDCIMEVKKVEKLVKSTQGQTLTTPLAKKPKLEQQLQQQNGLDEPMEQELMEKVKPVGIVGPPGSPTTLDDLPTEMLLKIFDSLKINDLLRCGQVSNRIRSIAHHETLWQKVNLQNLSRFSAGLIQFILENGCKDLSIGTCKVEGHFIPTQTFQLKYLEAWDFSPVKTLEVILASSNLLEKLDLCYVRLSNSMISSINQNGKTLKQLNLTNSYPYKLSTNQNQFFQQNDSSKQNQFFQQFIGNCDVLTELNLEEVYCTNDSLDYLVNNLTVNIQKLNLRGINIKDHQLKILVTRCNKLTELNLHYTKVSNESVNHILAYLQSTLEKLYIRRRRPGRRIGDLDIRLDLVKLFELKSMKKLKLLDLIGPHQSEINILKKELPNIEILRYQMKM